MIFAAVLLVGGLIQSILGFAMGDWSTAGIWTALISIVLASVALLISGSRGLIGR